MDVEEGSVEGTHGRSNSAKRSILSRFSIFHKRGNANLPDLEIMTTARNVYNAKEVNVGRKTGETCLLLIDPQNDFCDPEGSLYVKGGDKDMKRFARAFLNHGLKYVNSIVVTLDTHQSYHIAHRAFWVGEDGKHPEPFTQIHSSAVRHGKWKAARPEHQKWAEEYVRTLFDAERPTLTIWPDHCIAGTKGHAVFHPLHEALVKWEKYHNKSVQYVLKGNNAFTEHYSAICAEVKRPNDPNTFVNEELLRTIHQHKHVIIAGEALSHCVNHTVRHIFEHSETSVVNKLLLCTDASASVEGFEEMGEDFLKFASENTVKLVSSTDAFLVKV